MSSSDEPLSTTGTSQAAETSPTRRERGGRGPTKVMLERAVAVAKDKGGKRVSVTSPDGYKVEIDLRDEGVEKPPVEELEI